MTAIVLHDGIIRRRLVAELEAFRAPDRRVSSYYLSMTAPPGSKPDAVRIALKNALAHERKRLDQLNVPPAVRQALRRDWEMVAEFAPASIGERHTLGLACFVASESDYVRALRLPWPIRNRAFFENRFVLWPLQQVLAQSDRYGLILADKEHSRLFLFFQERIEELLGHEDIVPGRVRYPDPFDESHYMRKHVEHFHHHFERVAELALRLYEWEPFDHLIIGGRSETLPQFESHLHRYLRDRIIARWEIDVRAPTAQILERACQEEQQFLQRQAQDLWKAIQEERPKRGALGPAEAFAALWQRRAQALLVEPGVARSGFRCSVCGRLQPGGGQCVECGGKTVEVQDVFEEVVHDAIEQSAQVRYYPDPALHAVDSMAVLKRF